MKQVLTVPSPKSGGAPAPPDFFSSLLGRKVGNRPPKKRVVVVCEGTRTEPMYLRLLCPVSRDSLVELLIVDEEATSPKQLVERACRERSEAARLARKTKDPNSEIDEIWCAFDVDDHPMIREARQQAEGNGIRLAISNPCIELWFLLHFVDQRAYIHRDSARRQLGEHIKGYDKSLSSLDGMAGRLHDALDRAQRLAAKHEMDGTRFPQDNPSSGMWKLVESLGTRY